MTLHCSNSLKWSVQAKANLHFQSASNYLLFVDIISQATVNGKNSVVRWYNPRVCLNWGIISWACHYCWISRTFSFTSSFHWFGYWFYLCYFSLIHVPCLPVHFAWWCATFDFSECFHWCLGDCVGLGKEKIRWNWRKMTYCVPPRILRCRKNHYHSWVYTRSTSFQEMNHLNLDLVFCFGS